MADDRTPTDQATDIIGLALWRADGWLDDDYPEKAMNHRAAARSVADALAAEPGLLRGLADQTDSGPLFEGTLAEAHDWWAAAIDTPDENRRVVVYPAPETTT